MDVDFRVMRTFLEFYKALLGFTFFKLYTDTGLVYPPPLDVKKDDAGAAVDAYRLEQATAPVEETAITKTSRKINLGDGKTVTTKDVRKTIETLEIEDEPNTKDTTEPRAVASAEAIVDDTLPTSEEFVAQPSTSSTEPSQTNLVTLHTLTTLPSSAHPTLFSSLTIFISRESPRHILEFVIKSFGGKVGWPATVGGGSPFDEPDPSITHVIIDRPLVEGAAPLNELERRRKYVQPQWIVDCVNAGKLLLEEPYGRGKVLPPHLSPFNAEGDGAYDPLAPIPGMEEALAAEGLEEEDEDEEMEDEEVEEMDEDEESAPAPAAEKPSKRSRHKKPKIDSTDADAIRKAELEAERLGIEPGEFEEAVEKASKQQPKKPEPQLDSDGEEAGATEENMNKMLLSNKKRKLFTHIKKVQGNRNSQVRLLCRTTRWCWLTRCLIIERGPSTEEDRSRQKAAQGGPKGRLIVVPILHPISLYIVSTCCPNYAAGLILYQVFQTISGSYFFLIS